MFGLEGISEPMVEALAGIVSPDWRRRMLLASCFCSTPTYSFDAPVRFFDLLKEYCPLSSLYFWPTARKKNQLCSLKLEEFHPKNEWSWSELEIMSEIFRKEKVKHSFQWPHVVCKKWMQRLNVKWRSEMKNVKITFWKTRDSTCDWIEIEIST